MKLFPCFISATLALKASLALKACLGKNAKSGIFSGKHMFVAHVSRHTTRLVQQTQGLQVLHFTFESALNQGGLIWY